MGNYCVKSEAAQATKSLAREAAQQVASFVTDKLEFFLYHVKDGNIFRYYLRNLKTIITDSLPFRDDDELLYFNGNVVNNPPEDVARVMGDVTPGKPITMITCRPLDQGNFTYNYVEGLIEESDLETDNYIPRPEMSEPLKFKPSVSYSTSAPVLEIPIVRVGHIESCVHRGNYLKYDPNFGNVGIARGVIEHDPNFKFWRCHFVFLEYLRNGNRGNPIREAYRPQSLPLFLSISLHGVSWQLRTAGQYGHPAEPSPDVLFVPKVVAGPLLSLESHSSQESLTALKMGTCCMKPAVVQATKTLAKEAAKLVASFVTGKLGFSLHQEKDGNIFRYFMRNLSEQITNNLQLRNDDELLYFNGNVVNNPPEDVARVMGDMTPGKPITMISSRPTGQGNFTYTYVEGVLEKPLYPDLEKDDHTSPEKPALERLRFRTTAKYTTPAPVLEIPDVRVGRIESGVHKGNYLKYDPNFGNVGMARGVIEDDPNFKFWRCHFVFLEYLRNGHRGTPIREAYRPQSLPLFLSISSHGVSWQFKSAGQYGHPVEPSPEILFIPNVVKGPLLALESFSLQGRYLKMSPRGLEVDLHGPSVSSESRIYFWDIDAR